MTAKTGKAKASTAVAQTYKPTPAERAAVEAHLARRKASKPTPRLKVTERAGAPLIGPDHPSDAVGVSLIMEAIGITDPDFFSGLIEQLANVGSQGRQVDERGLNFMLAVVKGIEPRDQVEAMLAAQMAAVHNSVMVFARRLNHAENLPQQEAAERAFTKLSRTFTMQLESLKRYRSTGEQKVTVEHVTVNEGGQAIVGTVTHGREGDRRKVGPTS